MSVSRTDPQGHALKFCNLSGCEQSVYCPTHIAGNTLDLVITDATVIVDVFVGTHWAFLITALSVVCFGLSNLYMSTMSEVLSFYSIVSTLIMSAMQSGALHEAPF